MTCGLWVWPCSCSSSNEKPPPRAPSPRAHAQNVISLFPSRRVFHRPFVASSCCSSVFQRSRRCCVMITSTHRGAALHNSSSLKDQWDGCLWRMEKGKLRRGSGNRERKESGSWRGLGRGGERMRGKMRRGRQTRRRGQKDGEQMKTWGEKEEIVTPLQGRARRRCSAAWWNVK